MTSAQQRYRSYISTIPSTVKLQQIITVYDGILAQLTLAKGAIAQHHAEDRYKALSQASSIILGLQAAVDFEHGGRIAQLLYEFYATLDQRIQAMHRTASVDECDAVMAEIAKMRSAWCQVEQ